MTFPFLRKSVDEAALTDWISDATTKFYSGVGVYQQDFLVKSVPSEPAFLEIEGGAAVTAPSVARAGPGMRAWYDPPVREAALVFVNGHRAGSMWHRPYRVAVGQYLKAG